MRRPVDFQAVKERIRLRDVLRLLDWEPSHREGNELRGWCPLHSDRPHESRSFAAAGDKWYCHRCKTGGDVLNLWAAVQRLDTYDAAIDLCERFDVRVPWGRHGSGWKRGREQ